MIGCKELRQYIRRATPDFRNLGRWHSWLVGKDPTHCTRVIFAYQVIKQGNNKGMKTILQQHCRAIQHLGLQTTPCQLFQDDLIGVMKHWRKMGERIILFIDANKHVITGKLPKRHLRNQTWRRQPILDGGRKNQGHISEGPFLQTASTTPNSV